QDDDRDPIRHRLFRRQNAPDDKRKAHFFLHASPRTLYAPPMFSHVVIFWTDPANPKATGELIAGAKKYLAPLPGIVHFHVGNMAPSHRPVVDQSYQVALNVVFDSKKAQDDYQAHPLHLEFVEKVFQPACKRVVVYDFE